MAQVMKRSGKVVEFDLGRIIDAIEKAMSETYEGVDSKLSLKIAESISKDVTKSGKVLSVEEIQDAVEEKLMASNRKAVAKKYILYRDNQSKARGTASKFTLLDDDFIAKYKHSKSPMQPLGEFVYYRTYSRWLPEYNRREYWWETVRRAVEYNCKLVPGTTKEEAQSLYDNVYNLRQFLSGRTFWVGGTPIADEYGMSNYNCAFCIIDSFDKFKELFYLLMLGTGVGFRSLKSDVEKLPKIRTNVKVIHSDYNALAQHDREDNTSLEFINTIAKITVGDSKEGWAQALDFYFKLLYSHEYKKITTVIVNYDNVRPKGERLKRFGGTASGHGSLKNMFDKITTVIHRLGDGYSKLRPIHCLDICNIIGENVVVGGVRRTAEAGVIDEYDKECLSAKAGLYYKDENDAWVKNLEISHREMSNNSIFYEDKPLREQLHWQVTQMRYSGEPGFINKKAAMKRRKDFEGVNPCVEILLRDRGLCNLTTVNVAAFVVDGVLMVAELLEAQRKSVRAGLRMTCLNLEMPEWDRVQREDRLLGVSLTGWRDAIDALDYTLEQEDRLLIMLRTVSHSVAKIYAAELGINVPLLVCTIKPEGTLSQLAGVSSGLHYAHASWFIRRVRISSSDPLVKVCEELGYPVFAEPGQEWETCTTKVVEFPMKSPVKKTKYEVTAIEQLEHYRSFMTHYVDHNASITVTVRNHEWDEVEQWLWDNWDDVVAVSFLSLDDNFYALAPYEAITEEEYTKRTSEMKPFLPSLLAKYETVETELDTGNDGCASGVCPIR